MDKKVLKALVSCVSAAEVRMSAPVRQSTRQQALRALNITNKTLSTIFTPRHCLSTPNAAAAPVSSDFSTIHSSSQPAPNYNRTRTFPRSSHSNVFFSANIQYFPLTNTFTNAIKSSRGINSHDSFNMKPSYGQFLFPHISRPYQFPHSIISSGTSKASLSVGDRSSSESSRPRGTRVYSSAASSSSPSSWEHHAPNTDAEANAIFETCWKKFEESCGGKLAVPREVVWLNGAPGSGKGANSPFIMTTMGASRVIPVSRLLSASPEFISIIESGELVPDTLVLSVLLQALMSPEQAGLEGSAVIVDGFPRTPLQVQLVQLMFHRLLERHHDHMKATAARTPRLGDKTPRRPRFKAVVLYVDEETSVSRQLARGRAAEEQLRQRRDMIPSGSDSADMGEGVRATDLSKAIARRRYEVFREHAGTLVKLQEVCPYHVINAMGSFAEVQAAIRRELRYQSSLELSEGAFRAVASLPLALDLVMDSRQHLVARLDRAWTDNPLLFEQVTQIIRDEVVPHVRSFAFAGEMVYRPKNDFFARHPTARGVLVDIMSDRGFGVTHQEEMTWRPVSVDMATGELKLEERPQQVFTIKFHRAELRDQEHLTEDGSERLAPHTASTTVKIHQVSAAGPKSGGGDIAANLGVEDRRQAHTLFTQVALRMNKGTEQPLSVTQMVGKFSQEEAAFRSNTRQSRGNVKFASKPSTAQSCGVSSPSSEQQSSSVIRKAVMDEIQHEATGGNHNSPVGGHPQWDAWMGYACTSEESDYDNEVSDFTD